MILTNGKSRAEILEKGAYVQSLQLSGHEILKPSEDGEQTHGGMALLLPYANRVRNASYLWEDIEYSLPRNNGEHSIHGLTKDLDWDLESKDEKRGICRMELNLPDYPTRLGLNVTYELGSDTFSVAIEAENRGKKAAPFMAGMHPYFNYSENWAVESMQNLLRLNYEMGYFPDGSMTPVKPGALNSRCGISFDNTYLTNSVPTLLVGQRKIRIETTNMPYLVLYNGQYSRGKSVAAEPMSAAPDAYNNGIGLVSIPPGGKFHCSAAFRLL